MVRHLLLDLDPYGGTDQLGMFPLFLKRTADVMAVDRRGKEVAITADIMASRRDTRRLVCLGSFPAR